LHRYADLSRNASRVAERFFDIDTMFQKYAEIYESSLTV